MAILESKLRLPSSPLSNLSKLFYSSQSQPQIEEQYLPNDTTPLNKTTPQHPLHQNSQIVQKIFSSIQHYHLRNPNSHLSAQNPNLKISSLPLHFSKIASLPSDPPLSPSVVRRVIDKCGEVRGDAPFFETLAFFNWATSRPDFPRMPEPYNEMIDFAGKVRNFGLVWELVELMRLRNVEITDVTLFVVVRRYVRAGLIAEAVHVFDRIRDCGCVADGCVAFKSAVRYLCGVKKAIEAQWFFDRLEGRFRPDVSVYNGLLEVWCRSGNVLEAMRVHQNMKRSGIVLNVYSYSVVIDALCRSGQIVEAGKEFAQMVNAGCKPDRVTFNSLFFAHLKANNHDKVLELYDTMKRLKCSPGTITCNYVLEANCKQNNLEKAIELLDYMYKNNCAPNATSYNILFGCIVKLKHAKTTQLLCHRIKDLKCKHDIAVYNKLIPMFGKLKSKHLVLKLKEEMDEKKVEPNAATYHLLLRVLCKKRQWENAYKFFTEMIEEKQLKPEEKTYDMVIKQLKKAGQLEKVESLAKKMVAKGIHALPENRSLLRIIDIMAPGKMRRSQASQSCTVIDKKSGKPS